MTADFWGEVWRSGRTGFHHDQVNPVLIAHHARIADADRVLVPLCGRTPDLAWLAQRHREVVGIEFVESAVTGYASDHGLAEAEPVGPFRAFRRDSLTLLLGDFFTADPAQLGHFGGAWDRAALIALDAATRPRYAAACERLLAPGGVILLTTLDRGAVADGPPYSVDDDEVRGLYRASVRPLAEEPSGGHTIRTYAIG